MYLVRWGLSNYFSRVQSAVDLNDEPIADLVRSGSKPLKARLHTLSPELPLGDFVHSISQELIVSPRAYHLISEFFNEEEIMTIPVEFPNSEQVDVEGYNLLIPTKSRDVLNRNMSIFEEINGFLFDVEKWVLSKELIPSTDFFYIEPGNWIVSDRLGESFERMNVRGLKLQSVDVV